MIQNCNTTLTQHSLLTTTDRQQQPRNNSLLGRTVCWFRAAEASRETRIFRKIVAISLAIFLSLSVIGIPVVILAAIEWKKQEKAVLLKTNKQVEEIPAPPVDPSLPKPPPLDPSQSEPIKSEPINEPIKSEPIQEIGLPEELMECIGKLHDLSRIEPLSYVHMDRNGRFINTADGRIGLQGLANMWKGRKPGQLATDLSTLYDTVLPTIDKVLSSCSTKKEGSVLPFLKERIQAANEGLQALKATYAKSQVVVAAVNGLISEFKKKEEEIDRLLANKEIQQSAYSDILDVIWRKDSQQLRPEVVGWGKYLINYSAALYYNHYKYLSGEWNWQDKIGDFKIGSLYLGVLPTISTWQNHLVWMTKEGITDVLSVTEVFENRSRGLILNPITPEQFEKANISQYQLPAPDFGSLSMEQLERGVEHLHAKLQQGKKIYVHCKAGRGRSALVVMGYLIKYQNKTAEEASSFVKQQRKQAGFEQTDPKWATLKQYEQKIQSK